METASHSETKTNYLNADYGIKSWLLTTDHKRIAILYLGSITAFFFQRLHERWSRSTEWSIPSLPLQ